MTIGNQFNNGQTPAYPYGYTEQASPASQSELYYSNQNATPWQAMGAPAAGAQVPGAMQGLLVPGSSGTSFDLSQIARLSLADFKFFVECSAYTRGDFAPMVRHCVNTTLGWANRLDSNGTEAYLLDGTQRGPTQVLRGQENAFADQVANSTSSRRLALSGMLREVMQQVLTTASRGGQLKPQVLLFAISGHHLDTDEIILALRHAKDTLKGMGYQHPEQVLMVGFLKVGERGGILSSSKNDLRRLDNDSVVGRMVESDVDVSANMETRIFKMLQRFCNPSANGDSKIAGFAQNMLSIVKG